MGDHSTPRHCASNRCKFHGILSLDKPPPDMLSSAHHAKSHFLQDSDSERVRVTVRARPFMKVEEGHENEIPVVFVNPVKSTVTVRRKGSFVDYTEFKFDAVLGDSATQADVYQVAAQPIVLDVLEGYNGTIMAYGQTGAGKTYTLSDVVINETNGSRVEGIIPRSAANIFEYAANDKSHEYHISMSYIQIYMETIQDLLNPETSNLQIREGEDGGIFIAGVHEIEVRSLEDVVTLLMLGDCNRQCAFTKLNAHSSRSHAIVIITVEKKTVHSLDTRNCADRRRTSKGILVGKLFLVDLAGSERLKKSGSEGLRATEAMSVNMSLTALGKCISARADPTVTHVPFRDSKLTRLLQESLGGNTKTSLIINIAPCCDYIQETLSSLKFGIRAMKVGSRAILNFEEEFRVLNRNLQEDSQSKDKQGSDTNSQIQKGDSEVWADAKCANPVDQKGRVSERKEKIKFRKTSMKEAEFGQDLKDVSVNCREEEIREVQNGYKKHFLDELQNEKRKVEIVAGSQLMANSAAKVLKSLSLIDEFFTKK
ncbi:hypothetical protein GOP47_0000545 [Adiantum capillus-veneris]|uniref:Kinesin-like protein n=1 Tax=Adiantum capillus-veneris TaxID=13818 RepID=A0A9D4VD73_ADICA|nr:hypothetical protein GOP47_0000545 [Adiantum capillus-veneris]